MSKPLWLIENDKDNEGHHDPFIVNITKTKQRASLTNNSSYMQ